jgi:Concanavalin A-like lectin/glucanases superfamily
MKRFSISILIILGITLTAFAVPPATKYIQGETLDPTCAPGDTNCTVNPNILGDYAGGNYTIFGDNGFLTMFGTAMVWDDMQVPVSATNAAGSNPPTFGLLQDSGAGSTDSGIVFDSIGNPAVITDSTDFDFSDDFTIDLWVSLDLDTNDFSGILEKSDEYRLRLNNGNDLEFRISTTSGIKYVTGSGAISKGQKQHIAIVIDVIGSDTNVKMYVNNILHGDETFSSSTPTATSNDIFVGSRVNGISRMKGTIDELKFYDAALTSSNVSDHYNDGAGELSDASETNLRTGYHFNNDLVDYEVGGSGSIDDSAVVSGGATYETGLIGSGATRGVYAYYFDQDSVEELHFTIQMPHTWNVGTDLHPHLHYVGTDAGETGNDVVWGLEYTVADVFGTFGNTTIISDPDTAGAPYVHEIGSFSSDIDMSGITGVSAMIVGRIFRDGSNASDTYDAPVGLLEVDFHIQKDTLGSQNEFSK